MANKAPLKFKEAAALLNISVRTLVRLRDEGAIPCVYLGKSVRFRLEDLDAYLAKGGSPLKRHFNLTIEFDSPEARKHFATWLCEAGEQDYWEWMRYRETESSGPITATRFHYHGPEDTSKAENDPARYGAFLCDNTVRTTCGRLTQDFEDEDAADD